MTVSLHISELLAQAALALGVSMSEIDFRGEHFKIDIGITH